MTPTPASGAAIQRFEVVDCIDSKHVPAVIPNPHGPWVRYEDHIAALAAGQATAAPVLWLSPEQFANFVDADEAPFGKYVPARKTSAGKFTMPLFAARAPADSVTAPAPPPECETEAEKRAFAFGWFKALESERMKAESVQEDAARESEYRRGYRHGYEQRDAEVRGAMA